jgi:hypothetical protein
LLLLGRSEEALATLRDALDRWGPGNTIDSEEYDLLAEAPHPPKGLEEMVALLHTAAEEEE